MQHDASILKRQDWSDCRLHATLRRVLCRVKEVNGWSAPSLTSQGAVSLDFFSPTGMQQVTLGKQSVADTPCSWSAYEALCLPGHPEATLVFHRGPHSVQAIWRLCSLVPPTYCPGHTASGVCTGTHGTANLGPFKPRHIVTTMA